jgi:hypothetical protein
MFKNLKYKTKQKIARKPEEFKHEMILQSHIEWSNNGIDIIDAFDIK